MVLKLDVLPKEGVRPETGIRLYETRLYSSDDLEERLSIPPEKFTFNMGHGDKELHVFRYNKRLKDELSNDVITKETALEI